MTKRSAIKNHIASLGEIGDIINAMKNLSLMEISKATKFLDTQKKAVDTIRNAAIDFFAFHPQLATPLFMAPPLVYILIGSERGFCGNFNEKIIKQWKNTVKEQKIAAPKILLVGNKLAAKIPTTTPNIENIGGPNAVEEIQAVILTLIKKLEDITRKSETPINPANWVIISNEETRTGIQSKVVQPFVTLRQDKAPPFTVPPLLYMNPYQFLTELMENYLSAVLSQLFYESFIIEHQERLKHMESASDWIKKKNEQLKLYMNELRQEEIIEEIEIIMLTESNIVTN